MGTPILTAEKVTIHLGVPALDAFGVFEAYSLDESWNGWVIPYFTKEEGLRICEWTQMMVAAFPPESVETVRWDDSLTAFVIESPYTPHGGTLPIPEEDVVRPATLWLGGVELFPIGARRWTWERI